MSIDQFEQHLQQNRRLMAAAIQRVVKRPEDLEDVLQTAMMQAHKAQKDFRGDADVKSWLYKIARNESLMWLRKRNNDRYNQTITLDESVTERLQLGNGMDRPEVRYGYLKLREKVEKLLEDLSATQRQVAMLSLFWEMKPWEAAVVLGISKSSAKSHLHKARCYLRKELVV